MMKIWLRTPRNAQNTQDYLILRKTVKKELQMKITRRNVSKKALTKFGPYLMHSSIAIVVIIEISDKSLSREAEKHIFRRLIRKTRFSFSFCGSKSLVFLTAGQKNLYSPVCSSEKSFPPSQLGRKMRNLYKIFLNLNL